MLAETFVADRVHSLAGGQCYVVRAITLHLVHFSASPALCTSFPPNGVPYTLFSNTGPLAVLPRLHNAPGDAARIRSSSSGIAAKGVSKLKFGSSSVCRESRAVCLLGRGASSRKQQKHRNSLPHCFSNALPCFSLASGWKMGGHPQITRQSESAESWAPYYRRSTPQLSRVPMYMAM